MPRVAASFMVISSRQQAMVALRHCDDVTEHRHGPVGEPFGGSPLRRYDRFTTGSAARKRDSLQSVRPRAQSGTCGGIAGSVYQSVLFGFRPARFGPPASAAD